MRKNIIVIGGGVIGLSSAYYLTKKGFNVTVVEKGLIGDACSKGNQGWVCPALHTPVPEPGLVGSSFKWLMQKDSPLFIKPTAVPNLSGWLRQFMKYCNHKDFKAGEDALHKLSASTFELFDGLIEDGVDVEMHSQGMLFIFLEEKQLEGHIKKFKERASLYGHEEPIELSKEEVLNLEPNLSQAVIGGLLLKDQRHVNPESLTNSLVKVLTQSGVKLLENTKVIDAEIYGEKIIAINTEKERLAADSFLISAGAWTGEIAKAFNLTIPIQAGKGYSVTISNSNLQFSHPLYLGDTKSGVSPFNHAVRIGGTMELSGINTKLDKNRINGIRKSVSKYLKETLYGDIEREWTGMRPLTPDGLPVMGKIPNLENGYIASGHGMVGVSMAPATGVIISQLIANGTTDYDISPFRPDRFTKEKKRPKEIGGKILK